MNQDKFKHLKLCADFIALFLAIYPWALAIWYVLDLDKSLPVTHPLPLELQFMFIEVIAWPLSLIWLMYRYMAKVRNIALVNNILGNARYRNAIAFSIIGGIIIIRIYFATLQHGGK